MTLVDTSVWIQHFRESNAILMELLYEGKVLCHPFVIGELACGTMANRNAILDLMQALPSSPVAEHEEVLGLLHVEHLYGQGLGWVDLHILASTRLGSAILWTFDKQLHRAASALKLTRF